MSTNSKSVLVNGRSIGEVWKNKRNWSLYIPNRGKSSHKRMSDARSHVAGLFRVNEEDVRISRSV